MDRYLDTLKNIGNRGLCFFEDRPSYLYFYHAAPFNELDLGNRIARGEATLSNIRPVDMRLLCRAGFLEMTDPYHGTRSVLLTYQGRLALQALDTEDREHLIDVYGQNHDLCCDLFVRGNCVCSIRTICPIHGSHCHGTHD